MHHKRRAIRSPKKRGFEQIALTKFSRLGRPVSGEKTMKEASVHSRVKKLIAQFKCAMSFAVWPIFVSVFLAGCDSQPSRSPLVGKWFNNEKNSVIEFRDNGAFNFSNAGTGILPYAAEWLIVEQGRVRIQVSGLGAPPPEVCNYQVNGDTLHFSSCTLPLMWKRVPQ